MYSNLLEHVKEYSDFYFPFLFGLIFPITISKIYRCNRKSEVNSSECQDSFFQEMKWSILSLSVYITIYWLGSESENIMYYKKSKNLWKLVLMKTPQHWIHPKVQILTRSPKTYENSTTWIYLKVQILIRSQKKLWKLHNIDYILEQLWWMRVQQF